MSTSRDGAGLPAALFVALLLLLGIAAVGLAAGPEVVAGRPTGPQVPAQGNELSNEAVVREALGEAFEVRDGEVVAERIEGLPVELSAVATVSVIPAAASSYSCSPADEPGACRAERIAQGVVVYVVTAGAVHSAAGSNFGETTVRHERGGYLARVQVSVLGKPAAGSTPELEQQVREWLTAIEPRLIAAATDERLAAPDPDVANRTVLRDVLGASSFGEDFLLLPASPLSAGLPAGFVAGAGAGVAPVEESLEQQCPVIPAGSAETCEVRALADGTKIAVHWQPLRVFEDGSAVASLLVYFVQANGDLVQAGVSANGMATENEAALRAQLLTWLAQFEDGLITAATDPRMKRGF